MIKSVPFFLLLVVSLASCTHRIADVTMISTRNYESKANYVELKKYQKGKDRALYSILFIGPLGAPDIEDAVDQTVKQVEGGEFLKNVVIRERYNFFLLFSTRVFIVEGDVWGLGTGAVNHVITKTPIKAGDEVMWNSLFKKIRKGKITKVIDGSLREKVTLIGHLFDRIGGIIVCPALHQSPHFRNC